MRHPPDPVRYADRQKMCALQQNVNIERFMRLVSCCPDLHHYGAMPAKGGIKQRRGQRLRRCSSLCRSRISSFSSSSSSLVSFLVTSLPWLSSSVLDGPAPGEQKAKSTAVWIPSAPRLCLVVTPTQLTRPKNAGQASAEPRKRVSGLRLGSDI